MSLNTVNILGIKINSTSASSVLKEIIEFASTQSQPKIIFTPNPEFLVVAHEDSEFKKILNKADINLPDGIGLVWAGRILGQPIKERVSGADVVEKLLEAGNRERWEVGISGARRGNKAEEEILFKRLGEKYPGIKFVNLDVIARSVERRSNLAGSAISNGIATSRQGGTRNDKFKIVLVCHGMGGQEKWIMENKDKISSSIFMGVGGSLDFLTGFSQRAPTWIRTFGFEWLWRGVQKPKHFRRIWKATVVFGWMVIKEKLANR